MYFSTKRTLEFAAKLCQGVWLFEGTDSCVMLNAYRKGLCPQTPIIGASHLYLEGLQLSSASTNHAYNIYSPHCCFPCAKYVW